MSQLQARIKTENDILVVQFSGRVDVESAIPFRAACRQGLAKKRVVFDFQQMNFVGSTGMLAFLEALRDYCRENVGQVKFAGIGIELHRVLSATSLVQIEAFETASQAVEAFFFPPIVQIVSAAAPVMNAGIEDRCDIAVQVGSTADLLTSRYVAEEPKDLSVQDGDYDAAL